MNVNKDLLVKTKTLEQIEDETFKTEVYSSEEEDTGKLWIDGKHIYRKTYKVSNVNITSSSAYQLNLSSLGIEEFFLDVSHSGIWWGGTVWTPIIRTHANPQSQTDVRFIKNTQIFQILIGQNATDLTLIMTFEYTKK